MSSHNASMTDLPNSLWCEARFHIPESLLDALWFVLEENGLVELAKLEEVPKVVGGISKEETDEYLAKLCAVSCVRPISLLFDPDRRHPAPQRILRRCLHQGKLALIDLPCGPGTTTLSLLSAVEQMRKEGYWIGFDLEVHILALDISYHALEHFQKLLKLCERKFREQQITIIFDSEVVDIEDKTLVSGTINDWIDSKKNEVDNILVIASAFSGYARQSRDKQDHVFEAFDYIKKRLISGMNQSRFLIWIETNSKSGIKFFDWLAQKLGLRSSESESRYKLFNPFQKKERSCNLRSGYYVISDKVCSDKYLSDFHERL
jgi:hypothetical protein